MNTAIPTEEVKCFKCDGRGWYEDHSDDHHANNHLPCDGFDCPIQRPCEICKGGTQ